jgi:hypothetical protein
MGAGVRSTLGLPGRRTLGAAAAASQLGTTPAAAPLVQDALTAQRAAATTGTTPAATPPKGFGYIDGKPVGRQGALIKATQAAEAREAARKKLTDATLHPPIATTLSRSQDTLAANLAAGRARVSARGASKGRY